MHAFQIKLLLKICFFCFKCIQALISFDKEISGLKQTVQKILIAGNLIASALFFRRNAASINITPKLRTCLLITNI